MERMRALVACGYGKRQLRPWYADGTRALLFNAPALWANALRTTFRSDEQFFRLYIQIWSSWSSAQWLTTVSDARLFGEGTVTANTIRLLFRLQPNTVILGVTKASVQLMNNLAAGTLYSARDRVGRVLSEENISFPVTPHDHAKSLQGDRYCQW